MKLIYTPDGAEPREWSFTPFGLDVDEVIDIETVTGTLHSAWVQALQSGGAKAHKALLWVLMRRDNPTLRYDQVRFSMQQVQIDLDAQEVRTFVDTMDEQVASGEVTLTKAMEEQLDELRATAAAPVDADGTDPKAPPSTSSSGSTSSPSPST